jgi:hypothetical protein
VDPLFVHANCAGRRRLRGHRPRYERAAGIAASFWLDAVQLESGSEATEFEAREPVELGVATAATETSTTAPSGHSPRLRQQPGGSGHFGSIDTRAGRLIWKRVAGRHIARRAAPGRPWLCPGKSPFRERPLPRHRRLNANDRDHAQSSVFGRLSNPIPTTTPPSGSISRDDPQQLHVLSKAGIRWVRTWPSIGMGRARPGPGSWTAPGRTARTHHGGGAINP